MDDLDPGYVKNLLVVEYVEHDHNIRTSTNPTATAEELGALECIEKVYRTLFDADVLEEIAERK